MNTAPFDSHYEYATIYDIYEPKAKPVGQVTITFSDLPNTRFNEVRYKDF